MSKLIVTVKGESRTRGHVDLLRKEVDVFDLAERVKDLGRRVGVGSSAIALRGIATEVGELVRDEIIEDVMREIEE